ncbi:MAG TPA: aminotransferase class V-fold PLP-dependent enzyme [Thermohalobaculum sp.]|nr:aminotransferase class V-fold PLP-dependent enzyme [Thermohalobaculum sp.]
MRHRDDTIGADRAGPAPRRALPAPPGDFIGLAGKVHLATGGEPPLLEAHRAAFEAFARDKSDGFDGYWRHWQVAGEVRARLARWLGLEPGDVALLGNASEGIMRVVAGLDWQPGDNAVVAALDYASGRFALASLKRRGVALRLVPADGWRLDEARLVAACDGRTRLVYVSQVNALTGQHLDIPAISRGLEGGPAALLVDASHALGAVPVAGGQADFTVSCCYKFALGIHEGVLGWNRRRRPDFVPAGAGWCSGAAGTDPGDFVPEADARQAEYGNAGHLGAYLLRESLDYLEGYGIEAIAAHLRGLSGRLVEGMSGLGLDVMTPAEPARRAGNAAFAHPAAEAVRRRAAREGILVWADNGRLRASAHLFTRPGDVELLIERLPALLG